MIIENFENNARDGLFCALHGTADTIVTAQEMFGNATNFGCSDAAQGFPSNKSVLYVVMSSLIFGRRNQIDIGLPGCRDLNLRGSTLAG